MQPKPMAKRQPQERLCPECRGTGRLAKSVSGAGRAGGNQTVINSRRPDGLSMSARSKLARRHRALTLRDIGEPQAP